MNKIKTTFLSVLATSLLISQANAIENPDLDMLDEVLVTYFDVVGSNGKNWIGSFSHKSEHYCDVSVEPCYIYTDTHTDKIANLNNIDETPCDYEKELCYIVPNRPSISIVDSGEISGYQNCDVNTQACYIFENAPPTITFDYPIVSAPVVTMVDSSRTY